MFIIHAQCQQVAHLTFQKYGNMAYQGSRGAGKGGASEEGGAQKNKGVAACFEGGGGGDIEGQRDTGTIHTLASRSPFQSHWPTNQGMAVTSFIIGYFFFLLLLNVCRLPASFPSSFRIETSLDADPRVEK